jgi:hypothetical protein
MVKLIEERIADLIREYRIGQLGVRHDLINVVSYNLAGQMLIKASGHGIKVDGLYVLQLRGGT